MSNDSFIDIDLGEFAPPTKSQIHVIAGGPCSGKTSVIKALQARGHSVAYEPAELLLLANTQKGENAKSMRQDAIRWQKKVITADINLFKRLSSEGEVFVDTTYIETLVYCRQAGLELGPGIKSFFAKVRFSHVFFLEPLPNYEATSIRLEKESTARMLSNEILDTYREYKYQPVLIPPLSIAKRVDLIEAITNSHLSSWSK